MLSHLFNSYSHIHELEIGERPVPEPNKDEVLIKVHCASLNDWDLELLQGKPFINKILFGLFKPKIASLGIDVAGEVIALGEDCKNFQIGDSVFGDLSSGKWGALAQFTTAKEKELHKIPDGMSFEEAAATPQAALLALQGLLGFGNLDKGKTILINGAGGGVGTFAIQLAKASGLHITGVDKESKFELMKSLGCDVVIDYRKENFTDRRDSFDYILDAKSFLKPKDYLRALRKDGIYATAGGSIPLLLEIALKGFMASTFGSKKLKVIGLEPNKNLDIIIASFEEGKLKPVVDDNIFSLNQLADAFDYLQKGEHLGKVVIKIPH